MAVDILDRVGIPDAGTRSRAYPHQLSGGQRQRVMIAIAAIRSPQLLIADEPTTALDVTVQARLLRILKDIQVESRMAMLFITHDLTIVAEIADRVAVMNQGQIVEIAPTREIFGAPQHDYTKHLLASLPGRRPRPARGPKAARLSDNPLIRACGISVTFGGAMFHKTPPVYALRSVDLSVYPGERLGIVGESGSGKTTLGRVILGLQSRPRGHCALVAGTRFGSTVTRPYDSGAKYRWCFRIPRLRSIRAWPSDAPCGKDWTSMALANPMTVMRACARHSSRWV